MTKRLFPLFLLVTLLVSCGPTVGPTAPPGTAQPVVVQGSRFAVYKPVPVDVRPDAPAYTPDLDAVSNPEILSGLDAEELALLEENGFIILSRGGVEQIYTIYKSAKEGSRPVFVTTDAVLHAFHILYDYALRLTEMDYLIADLQALNAAMLAAAEADYNGATGAVQEAARQNLAFFAVGSRLLEPEVKVPNLVADLVEQELALIDAHTGFEPSPIFGSMEDYSQYVPRGHYTRNEQFEHYFRSMMWYGRMAFHLRNLNDPAAARRETRGALLITRALYNAQAGDKTALERWDRIYEPTAFFVGTADDLTVYDYAAVAQEVYGGLPDPAALADEAKLEAFAEAALKLRPPAIVGGYVTDQEDPEVVTMGLRFMGQRFIPDSYIFQQLVYDKVQRYTGQGRPFTLSESLAGPIRGVPRGLDVPAALGSARALEILAMEGDTDYLGYDEQLAKVQVEFADLPASQWTANLYWNWLYTLRALLTVKGEGYPYFMRSPAWVDKDLHTWLGSWTELRHDTILYAKQSYTILATSMPPQPEAVSGYVEPQPEVYARLAALAMQMREGLSDRGLLRSEIEGKLQDLEELLLALKTISVKELQGETPTDDEYALLRNIGGTLESLTTFSEEVDGQVSSEADERMALVADVHTDGNTGNVLEEAVGDAYPIYVVVLVGGQQVVTVGGAFSYYEFRWPMSDRLTDEAWQEMAPKPERPAWVASFIR
jgi:hypothetical protein